MRTLGSPISALVLALSFAVPAAADPMDEAVDAYQRGDYPTSLKLSRPLAEQGLAAAQYNLGRLYETGRGVAQNYQLAASWNRKAAAQGLAEAEAKLGYLFEHGLGVPKDVALARTWYRTAANQGLAGAQFNLARLYATGQGVAQNSVQAYKWYSLAMASFATSEGDWKAKAISDRDTLAAQMTADQIAEAQRLARAWKPK